MLNYLLKIQNDGIKSEILCRFDAVFQAVQSVIQFYLVLSPSKSSVILNEISVFWKLIRYNESFVVQTLVIEKFDYIVV